MVSAGKIIPAEMIVRMLRKIIYSGSTNNKFILSSFPDIIEQAKEFEKNCATIDAIIYASNSADSYIEIKNNNLTLFNIDAMFQKEFRLKTVDHLNKLVLSKITENPTKFSLVYGEGSSGRTTVCKMLESVLGSKTIDLKLVKEDLRKRRGTEEEPYEGEITTEEISDEVRSIIASDKRAGLVTHYVFDHYHTFGDN